MRRIGRMLVVFVALAMPPGGCGGPTPSSAPQAPSDPNVRFNSSNPSSAESATKPNGKPRRAAAPQSAFWNSGSGAGSSQSGAARTPLPRRQIDDGRVKAAGIRKLQSKHLTLYTDVPPDTEVDLLPEVFDQAYPQWCRYFGVSPDDEPDWRMTGCLMKRRERFQAVDLLPESIPDFLYGYCRDNELWCDDQPSPYYRRHLLLHEGTHGFVYTRLRGNGPPWYREGIAELLGTHKLEDGQLRAPYFPANKEEVPLWGRIKIVKDGFEEHRALFLDQVIGYPNEAHLNNEAYGWCWAAAAFFDGHPRYRERFAEAAKLVTRADFAEQFRALYADDWEDLTEEWQLYISSIEYGHDLKRAAIEFAPGEAVPASGATVTLAADRGWQSSRLRLEAGTTYLVKAKGRYQVAQSPKPWECEPGGVTIRYYRGRPLGILLAAMRPDEREPQTPSGMFRDTAVGLETTLAPLQSGTLYLRINDSPAELADNAGTLEVEVKAIATVGARREELSGELSVVGSQLSVSRHTDNSQPTTLNPQPTTDNRQLTT